MVIAFSFNTSKMNITFEGFTLEWYGRMFENRQLMQSFFNTIIVAGASTVLSVIIGTLCALGLYKFESENFEGQGGALPTCGKKADHHIIQRHCQSKHHADYFSCDLFHALCGDYRPGKAGRL